MIYFILEVILSQVKYLIIKYKLRNLLNKKGLKFLKDFSLEVMLKKQDKRLNKLTNYNIKHM